MSIKWFNVRSKEVVVSQGEPHIAAMWASSDRSPNATVGQDFGWRLSPEDFIELKRIRQDPETIEKIAGRIKKQIDEITEYDILLYISSTRSDADAPVGSNEDYTDEYNDQIRRLELGPETTTTTTTLSVSQLRLMLAEREQSEGGTTTTTTTKK